MPGHIRFALLLTVLALLVPAASLSAAGQRPADESDQPTPEQIKFFEHKVRPLLATHCFKCHGEDRQRGGLRLDSLGGMLTGGESGPAVVPGKPEESFLVDAIRYESFEMPPTGRLKDEDVEILVAWVRMGAPWPGTDGQVRPHAGPKEKITDEDRAWWAFQPVARPEPPPLSSDWIRNPVDAFILERLNTEGLTPADEADRLTLIRRLSFDLTGLPPDQAEVEAFLSDSSPRAYENLVDRLLESPRYGERWARHWLDLVRYAESDGWRQDAYRPYAWRYRDYVIRAFNDDKPFDRFILEQLAGDEIDPDDPDALAATGFLRHWLYEYNQRDSITQWSEIINDVTDVTADVFLGLGFGCARCHDHKFDPILQKDYYRLQAFFAALHPRDDVPIATPEERRLHDEQLKVWEEATADIRRQIDEIEAPHRAKARLKGIERFPADVQAMVMKDPAGRTPSEHKIAELADRQVQYEYNRMKVPEADEEKLKALRRQLTEFDHLKPEPLPPGMTVTDVGTTASPVMIPSARLQEELPPGFPTVLGYDGPAEIVPPPAGTPTTGRRTTLAMWIASPDNPLTARVIVNRVWQYHFGYGLVRTPSDFGRLGEPPTHPELLDWLAGRFVEEGWSLKWLHRLLVTSATYRQTALRESPQLAKLNDPENRWWWRMPIRRLDAEQIRDASLAVSGELDVRMHGEGVDASKPRRTIYTKVLRNTRDPLLAAFDVADGFSSTPTRNMTTTPTQSLLMINGSWMLDRAEKVARILQTASPASEYELVESAFQRVLGRTPEPEERDACAEFLRMQASRLHQTSSELAPVADSIRPQYGAAARFNPESPQEKLLFRSPERLPEADFTIEAVIQLSSLYPNASVRTIAAQWDGDPQTPGWSVGITSAKSRYQPRNLILQLAGDLAEGGQGYEVVPSDLRIELDRPYYVAVSVRIRETGPAGVTFTLRDLTDGSTQTAQVPHRVVGGFLTERPLTIGGRDGSARHSWDGLIDEVRLAKQALTADELLIGDSAATDAVVGFWRFESPGFYQDSSGNDHTLEPAAGHSLATARSAALADLCHVLLNSNEFLYVE